MKRTCLESHRRIDPHVHCRDGKQAYKSTIRSVSELARAQGIVHICDMPNTDPPILWEKDVVDRLKLAGKRKPVVGYSLYAGLTSDAKQIKKAADLVRKYREVLGLKLYPPENEKIKIFKTLAESGYAGVLAVHAEKASLFKPKLFNPKRPWTHNLAQPEEAEIASVKELIQFAEQVNFQGVIYFCHVTLPETAEIIWQAKKRLNVYSEVSPHHLLLNEAMMKGKEGGLLLKVNPPLRSQESARGLLKAIKNGLVDCIGSDFAPHALLEKLFPPYLSGIAYYQLYGMALDYLKKQGVSDKAIDDLTYWNVKKVFGDKLKDA